MYITLVIGSSAHTSLRISLYLYKYDGLHHYHHWEDVASIGSKKAFTDIHIDMLYILYLNIISRDSLPATQFYHHV